MTPFVPSPNETAVLTALRAFLLVALQAYSVEVVQAQANRVPEPTAANFVIMTSVLRDRLGTNVDTYQDVSFEASIAGKALTVSAVNFGAVQAGSTLFGAGVAASTTILSQTSGTPGGVGVYALSGASQSVTAEKMAAGLESLLQPIDLTVQLDVHSSDLATAGDMAQMIATLFRDDYACAFFAASYPGVVPLYADGPRQAPFINDQDQFESRYVVDAHLQVDQATLIQQQFADKLTPTSVPVDVTFQA